MSAENGQKKAGAAVFAQDEQQGGERVGLWVALGAAALTTVGVLATAFALATPDDAAEHAATASAPVVAEAAETAADAHHEHAHNHAQDAAHAHESETASAAALILADAQKQDSDAKVVVENGVVKFYFASGKTELAAGATDALKDVVAGVQEGKKAVVSGYADSTGNAAANEKISKERAFAVRDALLAAGVPESSIEMKKPQSNTGSGNNSEARRVEVVLQ